MHQNELKAIKTNVKKISPTSIIAMEIIRKSHCNFVPVKVRELLGISPGTLQNLRINGTLPYTKVGGIVYYDQEEIMEVMEKNRIHNKF